MRIIIVWVIVSYFIGSIPTGYLVTKLFHRDSNGKRDKLDIRSVGSGATGATNVGRAMGQGWARFTAVFDMLKGAFALLIAAHLGKSFLPDQQEILIALSGFAAVIGHNYPVWLGFKGGKGVATTYGTLFFIWTPESFAIVLLCGAIWYAIMKTSRYVSLASMLSMVAMPLFFWILKAPLSFTLVALALAALGVFRHRSNVVRLIHGNENRLK